MKSLDLVRNEDWRRHHLRSLVALLRERLQLRRWRLTPSETAIQPVVIGNNDEAVAVSEKLARDGLLVPAIRPPTVPQGTARLRISLSAAHSFEDVERLAAALNEIERAVLGSESRVSSSESSVPSCGALNLEP